jgi:50S ribosomal protein L16 3-hydroxylase
MFKNVSPGRFLADHWQKKPLYMPSAIEIELPALESGEIAWLATQPDVESRLVLTERDKGAIRYHVEHGPFTETDLGALPTSDWTLLIQDVEKHLPDFRRYFDLVPFIPSWRLDDLMVSIAAPGGSVGPHKDNYDVFLCQGDGTRNWKISEDRNVPPDTTAESMSLLMPFDATAEHTCETGDVIYIPPGIPHWGVAETLCTTYSIGMRAPTDAELAAASSRVLSTDADMPINEARFYVDDDLQQDESRYGRISIQTVKRLRAQNLLDASLSDEQLVRVFGAAVTDPKAWLDPDSPEKEDVQNFLREPSELRVHGMTMITWFQNDETRLVFINGSLQDFPESASDFVRALCVERMASKPLVKSVLDNPESSKFLEWLLQQGLLDIGQNSL